MNNRYLRLGVNIDCAAMIRMLMAVSIPIRSGCTCRPASAGADGITAHLREDRRT